MTYFLLLNGFSAIHTIVLYHTFCITVVFVLSPVSLNCQMKRAGHCSSKCSVSMETAGSIGTFKYIKFLVKKASH